MQLWRGLIVAIAVLFVGSGAASALSTNSTPVETTQIIAASLVTPAAAAPVQPAHEGEDHTMPILITGIASLAGLGFSLLVFLFRWATGTVHVPTEEEYQAAQRAIFGGHH